MKTLFVDTNIFLRFLLNDIPAQAQKTKKYLEQAQKGKVDLKVSQIVIFEIIFALEKFYDLNKDEVVKLVKTIVAAPYLEIEEREVFLEALDFYQEKNLDFVDIFLFCQAKNQEGEVLSFDKDFSKLAR